MDICRETAVNLAGLMRSRELSAREVMEAHLAQIARENPKVNAIVTLLPEQALAAAAAADEAQARGQATGILHGLPVVHKDLVETKGVRTTYGSPLYADHVLAILKDAGCDVVVHTMPAGEAGKRMSASCPIGKY